MSITDKTHATPAEFDALLARIEAAPAAPESWDDYHRDLPCSNGVPLWACCGLPGACGDC